MTEAEWLACEDPTLMLSHLQGGASDRKLRLFAVACCRRVIAWTEYADEICGSTEFADGSSEPFNRGDDYRNAVLVSEQFADGEVTRAELGEAYERADDNMFSECDYCSGDPFRDIASSKRKKLAEIPRLVQEMFYEFDHPTPDTPRPYPADIQAQEESRAQTHLLRDIFGNPFRPVTFSPNWRTDTALSLARQMYESRDFSAMPILADALQDAGCDSDDILSHCRGSGPHVRGCWVVDLVLGKE
jgi:hypothetical protein